MEKHAQSNILKSQQQKKMTYIEFSNNNKDITKRKKNM